MSSAKQNNKQSTKKGDKLRKDVTGQPENCADLAVDDEASMATQVNMAAIISLLEEHKEALSAEFRSAIAPLQSSIEQIQVTVVDHGQRITSLETNTNDYSDRLVTLETTCKRLEASSAKLKAKVVDLESRSRRCNLRIIGVPESAEGPQPTAFFSDFLHRLLGPDILATPPELDRAHRSAAAKPGPGEKPRSVIVRFHNFKTKEKVLHAARKLRAQGKLRYQNKPISIYEDYSPEVMELRSPYRDVMDQLYQRGLKPSLRFPAKLVITVANGDRVWLTSVGEAVKYLGDSHPGS